MRRDEEAIEEEEARKRRWSKKRKSETETERRNEGERKKERERGRERRQDTGNSLQRFIGQRCLMGTMLVPHFLHNLENGAAPSTDGRERRVYAGASFFSRRRRRNKNCRLHALIRFFASCSLENVGRSKIYQKAMHRSARIPIFLRRKGAHTLPALKIIQNKSPVSIGPGKKKEKVSRRPGTGTQRARGPSLRSLPPQARARLRAPVCVCTPTRPLQAHADK